MLEKIVNFPYVDAIAYTTLSQQDVYWIGSDQKDKRLWIATSLLWTSLNLATFTYILGWLRQQLNL